MILLHVCLVYDVLCGNIKIKSPSDLYVSTDDRPRNVESTI